MRANQLSATLAAMLMIGAAVAGAQPVPKPTPPPNIIVILCDDMGYSDLGCYGSEIRTPNLDGLAANGLRFTQFYNTARCCPSRASLLSGLYAHQTGVGHMTGGKPDPDGYTGDLNRHCVTIAQVLKPAGYATYMVGKWHVAAHDSPAGPKNNWPMQRGFDRYYGTVIGAGSFYDPGMLTRDNTPISPFADPEYHPPAGEPYYYTNALSDQAARFITEHHQQHAEQPFFFYVAFTAAHWPMHALEKDIAPYHGVYDAGYEPIRKARFEKEKKLGLIDPTWDLSPQAGDWDQVKNKAWESRCMEVYAAMISTMDRGVGRIVESLKQTGQLENTLIFFLQDNGGNLETVGREPGAGRGDGPTLPKFGPDFIETNGHPTRTRDGWPVLHGPAAMPGPADTYIAYGKEWANVSNTPFREYKHFVHEGGIATPLIVHWPARVKRKGEFEKQPGHLIDLMATCVDLAKADYPKTLDGQEIYPMEGRSLLPAFEGNPIEREAIYWEHEGNRAVRQGDWKLVAKGAAGAWELYNMGADRTEMHDLATSEPKKAADLQALWETWARRAHVLPWPYKPQYGAAASKEPEEPAGAAGLYQLKAGDDLAKDKAPRVRGKSLMIDAELTRIGSGGVIVAQGGTSEGYTLYVKAGRPSFAVRRAGLLVTVTSKDALPPAPVTLSAALAKDGTLTLSVQGQSVATGKAAGTLTRMPQDGLQVGRDANAAVGEYEAPFPFDGEIGKVVVKAGE